jgi:dipeptidyl aminopeptidase/acylaminoacyl peptidase
MPSQALRTTLSLLVCLSPLAAASQAAKPAITLDEYLNTTEITEARLSPDGQSAVIATESPDWKANNYRHDLWLSNAATGLRPLTHSGSEENAQWSPDGKWIAFVSDRGLSGEADDDSSSGKNRDGNGNSRAEKDSGESKDSADRLWLIPVSGGEALPLFREKLDVHAYAWSPDGTAIYYSVTSPLTHEQEEAQKARWKDVIQWREQHRGDLLIKQPVAPALASAVAVEMPQKANDSKSDEARKTGNSPDKESDLPPGAETIARSNISIGEIAPAPDGKSVAYVTEPVHHRMESPADFEIFLAATSPNGETLQLTHNEATESGLRWSPDSRWLYFTVQAAAGSLEGKYRDVQGRLYRMDLAGQLHADAETVIKPQRLGSAFDGSWEQFVLLPDGRQIALGLKGTEDQLYLVDGDKATRLPGLPGSYAGLDAAPGKQASGSILVRHSTITTPIQAYIAADPLHPDQLTPLTSFNPIFAQRAQPQWQPYTWKSTDGQSVEGVLIFPPGQKDAKHLRMLTLIHGGPADADGNRFGADWYDWATFAAANGWLVFRPNYRGSSGYGDEFMLQIAPHLVSVPGRDILSGVDALVKDGYADPDHLAIGGYSYGGYMTNWLITQTTRFKAAVTGAGAVEHAANWGNDDESWDDAWYLGAEPWQNPAIYQSEAALFQFDKVKTPTHLVQGAADVRVSYLEGVTMERALQALHIPHRFLVFPGEGHGLPKNPWHGYIKLREELDWLNTYATR